MRNWTRLAAVLCAVTGCVGRDNPSPDDVRHGATAERADTCWRGTPDLAALKEPALLEVAPSTDTEAVRFLWFPTFHTTVSVRLVRRGETYALVRTQRPPEGRESRALRRDSLPITAARWIELTAPVRSDAFWSPDPLAGVVVVDGSTWRVEALLEGVCRAVEYWGPEVAGRGAEVREFGTRMLDAAGVVPEMIY
jgi:hypothetical protein